MYIYFDENGTIKEVVNDKSIRQGSNEANKLYCYIESNPSIDDIWYLQKNVDGSLTNEISFKNSTVTKAIPYDAKRDMRYFKDFETYTFYVFTLTTNYLKQSGLVSGTIRIEVDNEIFALGELKFNVQENVINVSNNITQSQYDYLLLAYASRTLNEQTGSDLDHLLDEKIDAKIGDIADGSPRVFDTTAHIQALTSDMGVAIATDTGYIWVWNDTDGEYKNTNYIYLANVSAYYTKTEADNTFAKKSANNTFTGENEFTEKVTFFDDIEIGGGDINQTNGSYSTNGNVEAQSITIDGENLEDLFADKSDTYSKSEVDGFLNDVNDELDLKANSSDVYTKTAVNTLLYPKADKSDTYTKSEVNTMLNNKADVTTVIGINTRVGSLENEVDKLQSVQNVVDVVATKNDLNNYPTSDLEVDDKIQVIADESQGGASTIYNWNGNIWEYVGAFGGNSYTKYETLQQIDLHKLINKTYAELQTMKTNGTLVAGQLYRITDYVTKTNGKCNNIANDVRSTEYPFDIILRAISTTEFSEQARAIWHSGDTYFANSELQAWKLWYCFDNDSVRFEWADTTTGKGVIYRMIDEFGNDLPYDFKNIQFKRYKITATSDPRQTNAIGNYYGFNGNYSCLSNSSDFIWCYTFSKRSDGSDLSLTQTLGGSWQNCYYTKEVIMAEYLTDNPNYRGCQALNNIVFICDNIIVDFQIGAGSHHNTIIGNKDLTYIYFKEMFRYNILYGEMSHTRADECFEQNMIGDFTDLSTDCTHWTRFAHHFGSNTAIHLTANDIKARVNNTKFPTTFFRCTISNIWDGVHARAHNTFSYCEFGYMSNVTLSGAGDWNGVRTIMNDHTTIKIAYLYGSTLGRMEYVSISEGAGNTYAIMNLTIGSIYGSSNKVLTIALSDLYSYELATSNEKKIDFAIDVPNDIRALYYTSKTITSSNILDGYNLKGTIQDDGSVVWSSLDNLSTKFAEVKTYTDTKFNQAKSYTDNAINDLRWELGSHTLDVESDTTTSFSKSVPSGAIGCQINKIGGMSRKCTNLWNTSFSGNEYNVSATITGLKNNTTYILKFWDNTVASNLTLTGATLVSVSGYQTRETAIFTTTDTTVIIALAGGSTSNKLNEKVNQRISLNEGSTALPYEPYFEGIRNTAVSQLTIRGVNLLQLNDVSQTTTSGITYSINNGVFSIVGTASERVEIRLTSFNFEIGTYSVKVFDTTNLGNVNVRFFASAIMSNSNLTSTTLSNTFSVQNEVTSDFGFVVPNGANVNATFKYMLVSGSTAPTEYKPYVTPIIKNIPSQIQALDGYGWGINDTCYNYIDFDRKVFVQKVDRVDLGSLNWSYNSSVGRFGATNFTTYKKPANNNTAIVGLSSVYDITSWNDLVNNNTNMNIACLSSDNNIIIRNTSYTDATTFATAMNGVYLYYELATPIETDISSYIINDTIDVEPLGTLEFTNTYNNDVPSDIDYLIEEVKA